MEPMLNLDAADNPFLGKTACCFTGHRPRGLPAPGSADMARLRQLLMQAIRARACPAA